ncbi:MAG: peptidase, partial [Azoarcus sp.]|nr:peptidase [Azoarcus sp.]
MKTKVIKLSGVAVAVAALAIGGYNFANHSIGSAHAATVPAPVVSAAQLSAEPSAAMTLPDFRSIAERYGPAVVNISVEGTIKTSASGQSPFAGMSPNDPFYD